MNKQRLLVLVAIVLGGVVSLLLPHQRTPIDIEYAEPGTNQDVTPEKASPQSPSGVDNTRVPFDRATLRGEVMWPQGTPAVSAIVRLAGDGNEWASVRPTGQFELPVPSRLEEGARVVLDVLAPCWHDPRKIEATILRTMRGGATVAELGLILLPDEVDCAVSIQLHKRFLERLQGLTTWTADLLLKERRVGGNPFVSIPILGKVSQSLEMSELSFHVTIPFRREVQAYLVLKPRRAGTGLKSLDACFEPAVGSTRFNPSRSNPNRWKLDFTALGCLELEVLDQFGQQVPQALLEVRQTNLGKLSLQVRGSMLGRDIVIGKLGSVLKVKSVINGSPVSSETKDIIVDNAKHAVVMDMSSRIQLIVTKDEQPLTRYHVGIPLEFEGKSSEHLPERRDGKSWLFDSVNGKRGMIVVGWMGTKGYVEKEFQVVPDGSPRLEIDLTGVREPVMGGLVISFPKDRKLRASLRRVHRDSKGISSMYHKLMVPFPGTTQRIKGVPGGRYELNVDSLRFAKFPNLAAGETDTGEKHLFRAEFEVRGGTKKLNVAEMLRDRGL